MQKTLMEPAYMGLTWLAGLFCPLTGPRPPCRRRSSVRTTNDAHREIMHPMRRQTDDQDDCSSTSAPRASLSLFLPAERVRAQDARMPLAFANTVDSSRRVLWCDRRRPSPRSVREGDGWMAHGDARHAGCPPCLSVCRRIRPRRASRQ